MRSKGVSVRLTSVEEVQASVATFGSKVADLLDERLGPAPEGLTAFSYQQVFDHLDSDLEAARLGLVKAEDEHVRQQIVISKLQRESDRSKAALYGQQVAVRQIVGGLFGPEAGFELAAIAGHTPRGRKDLEEQVDLTVKLLRDPEVEMPQPKIRQGVEIDLGAIADSLEAGKSELGAARSGLLRARKAGAQTMLVKHAAMTEFDRVFPATAATLEGFFRLVGEVDLADRIRTSIRRVTGRRGTEDDETPAEGAPSTDGESGDAASEAAPSSEAPSESPASGVSEPPSAEPAPPEPVEPAVSPV